jgi:hypothetical protein
VRGENPQAVDNSSTGLVYFIRGKSIKRGVRSFAIIESKIFVEAIVELITVAVIVDVDVLLLDGAPESFSNRVIGSASFSIHTNRYSS